MGISWEYHGEYGDIMRIGISWNIYVLSIWMIEATIMRHRTVVFFFWRGATAPSQKNMQFFQLGEQWSQRSAGLSDQTCQRSKWNQRRRRGRFHGQRWVLFNWSWCTNGQKLLKGWLQDKWLTSFRSRQDATNNPLSLFGPGYSPV